MSKKKEAITKRSVKAYIKQCTAILLITFALLNMIFLGMGEITVSTFWVGILFLGAITWVFYNKNDS